MIAWLRGRARRPAPLPAPPSDARVVSIAIIGSGFSGLGMAIRLKQEGEHDFVVLEKEDDIGGTWYVNNYPGCACDVQSHLYSFSFAQNPEWSRMFASQPEILAYLRACADRFDVRPHVRTSTAVESAEWDEAIGYWRIRLSGGRQLQARVLVSGAGGLSRPLIPDLPGLQAFQGEQFHSQRWNHDLDLRGKRVAVVGTGASAIQFVPEVAKQAAQLDLYQRSAPWILPKPDRAISDAERALYRRSRRARKAQRSRLYWQLESRALAFVVNRRLLKIAEREARSHLRAQVPDRALRARLKPDYAMGCKRALLSNDYYPALCRQNVSVHTHGIASVTANGIVDGDGVEHAADVIIYGTGFDVRNPLGPVEITGRDGVGLQDAWADRPQAYLGINVAGFPNLFLIMGPNTGLGHNSMVYMIEAQIEYVLKAVKAMRRRRLRALDIKPEVVLRYDAEVQAMSRDTVWTAGGCKSWYLDDKGNNFSLWPAFTWQYRARTQQFRLSHYRQQRQPRPSRYAATPDFNGQQMPQGT